MVSTPNVTRDGRVRFELVEGEIMICGCCERQILGTESAMMEENIAYITTDGLESQDYSVLCSECLEELAGPEFFEEEEASL